MRETEVTGAFLDVRAEIAWQSKTNGYIRNETAILKIVDGHEREVPAVCALRQCGPSRRSLASLAGPGTSLPRRHRADGCASRAKAVGWG
jgi:hypothetical protein